MKIREYAHLLHLRFGRLLTVCLLCFSVLLLLLPVTSWSAESTDQDEQSKNADISGMGLEELMNVEVTSASKKAEKLSQTSSAVYVITREDIERSGMASVPELLRLVPGLQVARVNGSTWAISARGFNDVFANKLLVLVDGRSVYSHLFSGVYWDMQDLLLADIERIEVIRGPGATMWGANAVNGVINIITRSAGDTEGTYARADSGSKGQSMTAFRFGSATGENGAFRMYLKSEHQDSWRFFDNASTMNWNRMLGGFRADWNLTDKSSFTVQGNAFTGKSSNEYTVGALDAPYFKTLPTTVDSNEQNLLARWVTKHSESSESQFQFYYDHAKRDEPLWVNDTVDAYDLSYQHTFAPIGRHNVMWGAEFQQSRETDSLITVSSAKTRSSVYSAFVQDDVTLKPNKLKLTLGTKLEHNDFSGFEFQPNVRLLWNPSPRQSVWGAVSSAVRTPTIGEKYGSLDVAVIPPSAQTMNLPVLVRFMGNPDLKSEILHAFELGYRTEPNDKLTLDFAAYYNNYIRLRDAHDYSQSVVMGQPPYILMTEMASNGPDGYVDGIEASARWQVNNRWKLSAGFNIFQANISGGLTANGLLVSNTTVNQFNISSYTNLSDKLQFDVMCFMVGRTPTCSSFYQPISQPYIPGYTRLDVRLSWLMSPDWSLVFGAQNLLQNEHQEFGVSVGGNPTYVPRTFFFNIKRNVF